MKRTASKRVCCQGSCWEKDFFPLHSWGIFRALFSFNSKTFESFRGRRTMWRIELLGPAAYRQRPARFGKKTCRFFPLVTACLACATRTAGRDFSGTGGKPDLITGWERNSTSSGSCMEQHRAPRWAGHAPKNTLV